MKPRTWLALLIPLLLTSSLSAQANRKPLLWGADLDGGIPYVFKNERGELAGFEVDLRDALARILDRPIEFHSYDFDTLLPGLERGDFDFAMNGIEITAERQDRVRFTKPYYLYQLQLVTRADESRCQNLDDCKTAGLTVATLEGSAAERLLHKLEIPCRTYRDQDAPYSELQRRRVDGVLLDVPIALYYAVPDAKLTHARKMTGLKFTGPTLGEGYYGIAVRKDHEDLAKDLDAALDKLRETGELKRILQKWELWNPDQYRLQNFSKLETIANPELNFRMILQMLLDGTKWTIVITVFSMALAVALGLPIALGRLYGPTPVRWLATSYVEFFRGIPILLLLYFIYFGIPGVFPMLKLDPILAAILGFGLNYAAFEAEIYRAGIGSVAAGQWEAAASLGMGPTLTFRRIIFPQAFRVIVPPMTNDLIALFKDTSVASVIAVVELSKQYQILTKSYGGFVEIGLMTAGLYLILSVPLGYWSRYLESRWQGRGA